MTLRLTGFILMALTSMLIGGSLPVAGVGVVETSDGHRVILGDEDATFETLDGDPKLNGTPAPDEATPLEETDMEPWRGYEQTWLANVTGVGSVLVMGEQTGVVLEAGGNQGDGGPPGDEESLESEDEMKEPRPEDDGDAGPSPGDGTGLEPTGGEGNMDVVAGKEDGLRSSEDAGGSWWLVGVLFAVAGGLGVGEVGQRWRRDRAVLVVPVLDGMREVVLVEAGEG